MIFGLDELKRSVAFLQQKRSQYYAQRLASPF